MPKRLTIDYIKNVMEKEGFTLISDSYKNKNSYVEYKCRYGHFCKIKWVNFNSNKKCLECSGNKKKTIEDIKTKLKLEGYTLLSNNYINNKIKGI